MQNELVLVTGAGSGIGAAVARRLGKDGYCVAVTDLDEDAARRVAQELGAEGGEAHAEVLDVTDQSSIKAALDAATERFGTLAGWVSNAGVSSMAPFFELAEHQIRVNSVCPGYVATAMQERELAWEAELRGTTPEAVREEWVADTPMGRIETPEDVAGVIAFLLGPDAAFMTGEAVAVNGGAHMD